MPSFLGGKSRGAFGLPAFFLAGNRMTIVAFEKEVSLKAFKVAYYSFSETIARAEKFSLTPFFFCACNT